MKYNTGCFKKSDTTCFWQKGVLICMKSVDIWITYSQKADFLYVEENFRFCRKLPIMRRFSKTGHFLHLRGEGTKQLSVFAFLNFNDTLYLHFSPKYPYEGLKWPHGHFLLISKNKNVIPFFHFRAFPGILKQFFSKKNSNMNTKWHFFGKLKKEIENGQNRKISYKIYMHQFFLSNF